MRCDAFDIRHLRMCIPIGSVCILFLRQGDKTGDQLSKWYGYIPSLTDYIPDENYNIT